MGCFRSWSSDSEASRERERPEFSKRPGNSGRSRSRLAVLLVLSLLAGPLSAAEPIRLTTDGKLKYSPVFLNGGKEIVYHDLEKPELYRLQRLNIATRTVEPVHPKAASSEFEASV